MWLGRLFCRFLACFFINFAKDLMAREGAKLPIFPVSMETRKRNHGTRAMVRSSLQRILRSTCLGNSAEDSPTWGGSVLGVSLHGLSPAIFVSIGREVLNSSVEDEKKNDEFEKLDTFHASNPVFRDIAVGIRRTRSTRARLEQTTPCTPYNRHLWFKATIIDKLIRQKPPRGAKVPWPYRLLTRDLQKER